MGVICPSDWDYYFVDLEKQNGPLLNRIKDGHFIVLNGTRASGKSTRMLCTIERLEREDFVCNQ